MQDKTAEALNDLSQVNGNSKLNQIKRQLIWLVVLVMVALICVMVLTSSDQKKPTHNLASDNSFLLSKNQLAQNLKTLYAPQNKSHPPKPVAFTNLPSLAVSHRESKEQLVRQNSPTEMYGRGPLQAKAAYPKKTARGAILNDGTGNAAFLNHASGASSIQAKQIRHLDCTIAQGEFLHAVLETAINSDLPGMVRAIVSEPVYAYRGERLLIPAGSRLIGQYASSVIEGQARVMVIWNRLLLPNGVSIRLDSPGTDALGEAGQGADSINRHFFSRFGNAALLSVIGAGVSTVGVNTQDRYNSAAMYRAAIAQSFQQAANKSLRQTQNQKPSLQIFQGAKINVFVAHDLNFYEAMRAKQR